MIRVRIVRKPYNAKITIFKLDTYEYILNFETEGQIFSWQVQIQFPNPILQSSALLFFLTAAGSFCHFKTNSQVSAMWRTCKGSILKILEICFCRSNTHFTHQKKEDYAWWKGQVKHFKMFKKKWINLVYFKIEFARDLKFGRMIPEHRPIFPWRVIW